MHPRSGDRTLWLGGVRFDGEPGLTGHSDGDAVCHAVADALLGAAAFGDVGQHFPDTDPSTAGIAGTELLRLTVKLLREAGLEPVSCDLTVICETPAIDPRREELRSSLALAIGVPPARVSVKATRPEGLALAGDGIGCLAIAVVG